MWMPPGITGRRLASASLPVSRSPWSLVTTAVSPVGPSGPVTGASTARTWPSNLPSAHARAARRWERRPSASASSRVMPRRCAIRSAAVNWSGRSSDQDGGNGLPGPAVTAAPRKTRLIDSIPQPMPTSIAPAAISPATRWTACWPEPQAQSIDVQAVVYGRPACSHAWRVTLLACSPAWVTQPPITCSTVSAARPLRSISARCTTPSSSAGCSPDRAPYRLPTGVRTASTMTASNGDATFSVMRRG